MRPAADALSRRRPAIGGWQSGVEESFAQFASGSRSSIWAGQAERPAFSLPCEGKLVFGCSAVQALFVSRPFDSRFVAELLVGRPARLGNPGWRLATLVKEFSSGGGGVEVEVGGHVVGRVFEFLFADFVSEVNQVRL